MKPAPVHPPRRARAGTVYVLVLMTTLIVAIMGLSAVSLSRIQARRERQAQDSAGARAAARAAIEWGFMKIRLETNWNNLLTGNAQWASNVSFAGGSYSLTMLQFDNTDPVNPRITLLAEGFHGGGEFRAQVVVVRGAWVEGDGWKQIVQ